MLTCPSPENIAFVSQLYSRLGGVVILLLISQVFYTILIVTMANNVSHLPGSMPGIDFATKVLVSKSSGTS